jgi:CBS domain-containing protein
MSTTEGSDRPGGSQQAPSYARSTVAEVMRPGVITCPPDTPLATVARMMARERIHCVIVSRERVWQVVTDIDLLRAAAEAFDEMTAGEVTTSDLPAVGDDEPLDRATQLMVEHEVAHVLVIAAGSRRPVGVISSLDVAKVLASGRG